MSESKLFVRLFLYVFGPLCAAALTFMFLSSLFIRAADPSDAKKRLVLINPDLPFDEVGEALKKAGMTRNAFAVPVILELQGTQSALLPGEYALSPSMGPREIVEVLLSGKVEKRNLQILAGDTIWSVSEKLKEAGILESVEAAKAFTDGVLLTKAGVSGPSFEGYIGVGFYEFQKPLTPQNIIWKMLDASEAAWTADFITQASKLKLTRHDVLTLASLLYAEAPSLDFYKGMASVYRNRVAKGLPLESLKALEYGIRDQTKEVPENSLEVESPYNTFTNIGLPPGPINNPSVDAIEAILFADASKYDYMLLHGGKVEFFVDKLGLDRAKQRYMIQ